MSESFASKLGVQIIPASDVSVDLFSADGNQLIVLGQCEATVGLKGLMIPHTFLVIKNLSHKALVGIEFLRQTSCKLDLKSNMASFFDDLVVLPLFHRSSEQAVVRTVTDVLIPSMSEAIVRVSVPRSFRGAMAILEPHGLVQQRAFAVAKSLVSVQTLPGHKLRNSFCRLLNLTSEPCRIRRGAVIATIHHVSSVAAATSSSVNNTQTSDNTEPLLSDIPIEQKIQKLQELGIQIDSELIGEESYHKLCALLFEYSDIFATKLSDLTGSNIIQCHIETQGAPFRIRPYRLSPEMKQEVDKQLDQMLQAGIIAESDNSPWASPIILARKSNGEWRFCSDMRRLNAQCQPMYHELPGLNDVIDMVSQNHSTIFTVCDLRSAFYQLSLTQESSIKTTFITPHRGAYKFLRAPMGYRNSPYFCTQALNKLFRHQIGSFLIVYIDDLLIASADVDSHLGHLRIVFSKLREANLKLHPNKCQLMLPELRYLGYIFSADGVRIDPKKTAVVRNYPRPKCQKEVRMFLGLTNFYRKAICHYADMAHPLTKLLRKDSTFVWNAEQEEAFQKLKDALINSPVMAIPRPTERFYLTCDASDVSVSFNLSQLIDGVEHVIEYGARGLRKSELNYTVTQKELLAIISGVQYYHDYLHGRAFTIRTDHQCLKYLNTMKNYTGRLARWRLLLSEYDYDVQYTKGRENTAADSLSRLELPAPENGPEAELDRMLMNIDFDADRSLKVKTPKLLEITLDWKHGFSPPSMIGAIDDSSSEDIDDGQQMTEVDLLEECEVSAEQEKCPDCKHLIFYIRDGMLATDDALARKITIQADNFLYQDGILFHLHLSRRKRLDQVDPVLKQLVVPRSLRERILKAYHDKNHHIGSDKMYHTIQRKFYWPNMYADVHMWTKSCLACQSGKRLRQTKAPLRSLQVEPTIFERWHVDHLALPEVDGFKYVLLAVDSFSLYSVLMPARTTSAEETARLLFDNVFMVYGCRSLLSDRGSCFMSKLLKHLCKLLHITQIRTSPRHPATNSRCEAYNRNILNALRTHCTGYRNWPSLLSSIAFSFRTAILSHVGLSPYRICFGFEPRLCIDNTLLPMSHLPTDVRTFVNEMKPQLEIIRDVVHRNQLDANLKTQNYYNQNSKVPQINIGDRVWLFDPKTKGPKLAHKCTPQYVGPFLVVDKNPDYYVYKLQDCKTKRLLKAWVHANRLKLFDDSRERFLTRNNYCGTPRLRQGQTAADMPSAVAAQLPTASHSASEAAAAPAAANLSSAATGNTTASSAADLPAAAAESADQWHEITDIVKHKRVKGAIHYYVKWALGGYSWVAENDITQAALDAYYVQRAQRARKRRRRRKKS